MKVLSARDPKANPNGGIDLLVLFEDLQHLGELPFSAQPNDTAQHGRDLYERAAAGEFGNVQ